MRSVVKAAIRIVLIYLFLTALLPLIQFFSVVLADTSDMPGIYTYSYFVFPVVLYILILCVLWWKTNWLVRFLAGSAPDDSLVITTSNIDLFIVALRILGIFLIVNAIADLIGLISYHFSIHEIYPEFIGTNMELDWIRELATNITTLVIGLVLAFSGSKLFNPFRNLWYTGSLSGKKPDSED